MNFLKNIFGVLLCYSVAVTATEEITPSLNISAGMFNTRPHQSIPQFEVEYRAAYRICKYVFPMGGLLITTKYSTYLYGGFGFDIPLLDRFTLTPTLAVGWYTRGKGKNLHYPLEFRSAGEITYQLFDNSRIGIQFSHISNASIAKRNPGVDSLLITYLIPLKCW